MTQEEVERDLYGAPAQHSEYRKGDIIKFADPDVPGGLDQAEVIYVAECAGGVPQSYFVLPQSTGFPVLVLASEIIEARS